MSRWVQVLAVALAAVVGLVPAFAQLGYAQAIPAQHSLVVLPHGEEMSDTELLDVEGEGDPLTVVACAIVGAVGGAGFELFKQGVEIAQGKRSHLDATEIGRAAGGGAVFGAVLSPTVPFVRSALACGARWAARAAIAAGTAATSAGHKVHEALHTVHMALHSYVREPVANFFKSACDWLWGR